MSIGLKQLCSLSGVIIGGWSPLSWPTAPLPVPGDTFWMPTADLGCAEPNGTGNVFGMTAGFAGKLGGAVKVLGKAWVTACAELGADECGLVEVGEVL